MIIEPDDIRNDPVYAYGYESGQEQAYLTAIRAQIDSLCSLITEWPHAWRLGDGYGGWVRMELEEAFQSWGLQSPPKSNRDESRRKPLKRSAIIAAMSQSQGRCVACGTDENLQVDHIVPVSRGGTNDQNNLQMLCKSCNASKRDKTMDEWQRRAS